MVAVSMEKSCDTVIPADLKRLFVSGTYTYVPLITKVLSLRIGLSEKPRGLQLLKNFTAFYGTRNFITAPAAN
jgi:hypothetical protein